MSNARETALTGPRGAGWPSMRGTGRLRQHAADEAV